VSRARALEHAADAAVLAPSVHNTQPWQIELRPDRLLLRADRSRQLTATDPLGRELVQSVGAALFNARVALAAAGWAVEVDRLPDPADPDLMAVVRPVLGTPDAELAGLAPAVAVRRTNRRAFTGETVPDEVLRRLSACADEEGAVLVPVLAEHHRLLVARLTQDADRLQNADPAYRAELHRWTNRSAAQRDGVPAAAVPSGEGAKHEDVPVRDFDTSGEGGLPADTRSSVRQTMVLLASPTDDARAWLAAGEALQHVLLELTREDWVASPLTQAIEVPLTRTQLRSALTWDAHPQMLLRIGHAGPTARTPRRPRGEVVHDDDQPGVPPGRPGAGRPQPVEPVPAHRPVSDGRGGTTWT
jgi:nitroreductase